MSRESSSVRLRVVREVCDKDGEPLFNEETRTPVQNQSPYHYKGVAHLPGDVFEMPAADAEKELANPNLRRVLEREAEHTERERKRQKRNEDKFDRHALARKKKELEEADATRKRLEQQIHERDQAAMGLKTAAQSSELEVLALRAELSKRDAALAAAAEKDRALADQKAETDKLRADFEQLKKLLESGGAPARERKQRESKEQPKDKGSEAG